MELLELHLFAGAGGGILGGHLLGHRVIGAIEIEAYPRKVLLARQLDGSLPGFPIWDDVTTFRIDNPDTRNYIERLQSVRDRLVICGGFPCQDISAAGKGAGIEGARSGMWKEMARIIGEVRPRYAFVENSPMLTTRGLGVVLADLAAMGFDAEWGVLSAADVGANHQRERIWVLGYSYDNGQAAAKVRASINERSNDSEAWKKQTSKFTGPSEQYAELAYTESLQRNGSTIYRKHSESEVSELRNSGCNNNLSNTNSTQCEGTEQPIGSIKKHAVIGQPSWGQTEPNVDRVVNGMAVKLDEP
jgi:DNA (cytosine-5)-methyltransferase 1